MRLDRETYDTLLYSLYMSLSSWITSSGPVADDLFKPEK